MAKPAPRPVLAKAGNAGAHPAAPQLASVPDTKNTEPPVSAPVEPPPEPVVMFSVRIPRSLRQAVKLAAVEQGATIEVWVEDALRGALSK